MLVKIRMYIRSLILPKELFINFLRNTEFAKVLDLGAGTGYILDIFKKIGNCKEYFGIEINPSYFKKVEPTFQIGPSVNRGTGYDLLVFCDVLHHVVPEDFFELYANEIQNAKYILVKEMSPESVFCKWWNRMHDLVFARQWIREISASEVELLMGKFGKSKVREQKHRVFLYDHYFMLFE